MTTTRVADSGGSLPDPRGPIRRRAGVRVIGGSLFALRVDWRQGDGALRTEFRLRQQVLWSGTWGLEIQLDGKPLAPPAVWDEICRYSDEHVDYLELEAEFGEGVRVQRHLLVAPEDRFLLVADAVLRACPGRLEYVGVLPLVEGVSFEGASQSREGFLVARRRYAAVLPLALPEWRVDARVGTLGATSRGLELYEGVEGRALFAPLFFDLDARRSRGPLTWRQVTVAENLALVPGDRAVGYRVQIGARQWLVYRSLGPKGNRTLLGHNLVSDMLVARFVRGEVEALLEIEG